MTIRKCAPARCCIDAPLTIRTSPSRCLSLRSIVVGGHAWTLRIAATSAMIENNQLVPVWLVWIVGACGSLLLSSLAFAMARSRHVLRERVLADERLLGTGTGRGDHPGKLAGSVHRHRRAGPHPRMEQTGGADFRLEQARGVGAAARRNHRAGELARGAHERDQELSRSQAHGAGQARRNAGVAA